jgi:predicted transcriptional regulator
MKLPNRERAMIAPDKLVEYLLNVEHERGGTKARLLAEFGYNQDNWRQLDMDIRRFHLDAEVDEMRRTLYGVRYEIRALLETPSGRTLTIRTIWQIDTGTDVPRLITLFPD